MYDNQEPKNRSFILFNIYVPWDKNQQSEPKWTALLPQIELYGCNSLDFCHVH